MVTINGLTEFNIQRCKREIERVNLAVKIDNAPRSQRPKLRACLRKMKPSIVASMVVENQFSKTKYWAQKLRSTARSFSETRELPENNQGKGAKHKTQFDDPGVKPRLEAFAHSLVPEAQGGFKGRIAPDKLRRYVNEHLFPELEIDDTIGVTTATAWLKKLGNAYQYEDEKEDDSGAASQTKKSTSNLKEIPPNLKPGDIIYYPIYHDESTVHANDQSHFVWETEDQHKLRQKSRGHLIHISDFIIEHCGRLVLTLEEIACEELLPKRPLSPAQLEVERIHLEAEAAVAAAAAEKERIAVEQGKKPRKKRAPKVTQAQASKAPLATDRTAEGLDWTPPPPPVPFKRYRCEQYDACHIIHPGAGHDPYWDMPQLIAQPKDMEQVLKERGLLDKLNAAADNRKCGSMADGICRGCAKSQKARDLEAKAHREGLDPEDAAGQGAFDDDEDDRFRERADGTFPTAQKLVPECIEAVSLDSIRRFFRHCYRYMDAYRHGLDPTQAAHAVKKYSSHRRIPVADVAMLKST
ncbi:hypothetical protein C8J57DRAFT_1639976 [Mycena rebaudengoi]|nr:hypothetical protein C8J57DRAFT_1639976 [Mycena rebaudengoi]